MKHWTGADWAAVILGGVVFSAVAGILLAWWWHAAGVAGAGG